MYQPTEHLRGIWGLESRAYTEQEIEASPHLQAAVAAGALVASRDAESVKSKPSAHIVAGPAPRAEHKED